VKYCERFPNTEACTKVNAEVARLRALPVEGEVAKAGPLGECPSGSHFVAYGGKAGSVGPFGARCISDNPTPITTTTPPTPTTTTTPATTTTPIGQTGQTTPNRNTGGSSSTFSTTIVNPAAPTTTTTTVSPEVSNCRVDGNANGFQQQFDNAKYSACGLYPTGQTAYTEGFTEGCMETGNTNQMCSAFIQLNTGAQSTTQTQPPTTAQPTQAIPSTQ
jgi:hypothetical protein